MKHEKPGQLAPSELEWVLHFHPFDMATSLFEDGFDKPVLFHHEGMCSLGALIALVRLDHPFFTCRMEAGDDENSDFLALNALGEVPVLYQNGRVLTENVAILQHIGQKDLALGLSFAAGTEKYDDLNRVLGFLSSDFHKTFGAMFSPDSFHPDESVQRQIKKHVIEGALKHVLQHADRHLFGSDSPYLFDHPTVADAYLFAMIRWGNGMYDYEKDFPNLARFQSAMSLEPAVKTALEIESGHLKKATGSFLGNLGFESFVKSAARRKQSASTENRPGLTTGPESDSRLSFSKKEG